MACGGDDDNSGTSSAPSGSAPTTPKAGDNAAAKDDGSAPQAPSAGGGDGFIELNGERHNIEQVLRCIPFEDKEGDLDLAAVAESGQLQLLITTSHQEVATGPTPQILEEEDIDLQGPAAGGLWSGGRSQSPANGWLDNEGNPADGPALTVNGNSMSGSIMLPDFNGTTATADVTFEFSFPSEAVDCSLR